MKDEDIVRWLHTTGSNPWVMYGLVALLFFLIWVNFKMWRRLQKARKDAELLIEWSDLGEEVELRMGLPKTMTKKNVEINVQASTLSVKLLGTGAKTPPALEVFCRPRDSHMRRPSAMRNPVPSQASTGRPPQGKLFRLVKSDETTWFIEDGTLKVLLTKQVDKPWKQLWDPASESLEKRKDD